MTKQSFLSSRFCNTAVRAIHQQRGVMVAKPGVQSSAAKSAAPQQKPDVQSTAAKPAPRERVRSRSPTSHAAPCRGCAQRGQTNEKHSTECRHLQLMVGCHACDAKGCWTGSPRCKFEGRIREANADADFGDNVSHMAGERNIQILCDRIPYKNGQRLSPFWFAGHSVLVRIDGKEYTMGEASGEGCNCLISTLMQSLGVICDMSLCF